jgi:hypothetical protein
MSYENDGYHIERQVLPAAFLDELEAAVFEPVALQAQYVLGRRFDMHEPYSVRRSIMAELKAKAPERYLSALKLTQLHPVVLAASANSALLAVLRRLGLRQPVVALKPIPLHTSFRDPASTSLSR